MSTRYVRPGESLQAALDAARPGDRLQLAAGTYREKVVVRTPGVTLAGEGPNRTVLAWDDYANKLHADGKEYNTFRTWTLAVCADGVTLEDLAVVNDALHPEVKGQEVALSVYGDGFQAVNCRLASTQDTLFVGPLPRDLIQRYDGFLPDELRADRALSQVFRDCLIEGTVDFIFGCGRALFHRCEIRSLADARGIGYVAAPAHSREDAPGLRDGLTFTACRFTCQEGVASGSIYLARPWRDAGLCLFEDCAYGPHLRAEGFDKWNDTHRDQTARFFESPPVPGRVDWCNRPERLGFPGSSDRFT